jgi:hypothetical protein
MYRNFNQELVLNKMENNKNADGDKFWFGDYTRDCK